MARIALGFGLVHGLAFATLIVRRVPHGRVALTGQVLAVAWMLERAGIARADPLVAATDRLVEHPFLVAAAVPVPAVG